MLECDEFDRDSPRNGSCQSAISKWTGDIFTRRGEIVKNSFSGMLTSVNARRQTSSGWESWAQSGFSSLSLETEFPWPVTGDGGQLMSPHTGHSQASTLSTFQVSHISSVTSQPVTPCILSISFIKQSDTNIGSSIQ